MREGRDFWNPSTYLISGLDFPSKFHFNRFTIQNLTILLDASIKYFALLLSLILVNKTRNSHQIHVIRCLLALGQVWPGSVQINKVRLAR